MFGTSIEYYTRPIENNLNFLGHVYTLFNILCIPIKMCVASCVSKVQRHAHQCMLVQQNGCHHIALYIEE